MNIVLLTSRVHDVFQGSPNFGMMLIGVVTGVIGSIVNQEGFSQKDVVSAALGLGLGFTVTIIFVLCSGSLISKVVRPWKIADENLQEQKDEWHEIGRRADDFYDNIDTKIDPDGDWKSENVDSAGFGGLGMPYVAQQLVDAGLTLDMLLEVNNEVLVDQLLQGAKVKTSGDRLRVILFIRKSSQAKTSERMEGTHTEPEATTTHLSSTESVESSDDEFVISPYL